MVAIDALYTQHYKTDVVVLAPGQTVDVADITVQRLCRQQLITAANRTLPGPTINAREGDTVVVHVFN
ncbi:hypothetical protein JHK87_001296 [Glycine soja]|nr:hypothetical protein JHK87_001296 [Glycine soja]